MVRPIRLLVTGKTEQQLIDEMRVLQLADEQGIKKPRIRTCYLCKRAEGENSLCIDEDKEDEAVLSPIELGPCEIELVGGVTFSYLLCIECSVLLNVMEEMEGDSDE